MLLSIVWRNPPHIEVVSVNTDKFGVIPMFDLATIAIVNLQAGACFTTLVKRGQFSRVLQISVLTKNMKLLLPK